MERKISFPSVDKSVVIEVIESDQNLRLKIKIEAISKTRSSAKIDEIRMQSRIRGRTGGCIET